MAETSRNKRRVPDDAPKSASKKARTESSSSIAPTIQVSLVKPKYSPPVIATTPGLSLSNDVKFQSYTTAEPATTKKKKTKDASVKDLLLHSASHRTLDYTAREDKAKGADSLLKHYIGVFDPLTGQLQAVEARKMVIRGAVRSRKAAAEAMAERTLKQINSELKAELGEAFGTKKAKKAQRAVIDNAIVTNGTKGILTASDASVMNLIKEGATGMASREELQAAIDEARAIPKGNFEAQDIQDVYDAEEIIGAEALHAIPVKDWQDKAKKGEEIQVPSAFVANRINKVASNESAARRLRILRYLLFLLIIWKTAGKGKERGAKSIARRDKLREFLQPAPDVVIESIRRKFSDQGEMRKRHQDLLIAHCCVFASIIDAFDVNTYDLRQDLMLEEKEMSQYFSEIGARTRVSTAGNKRQHFARLALPLQFPKMRQGRRR